MTILDNGKFILSIEKRSKFEIFMNTSLTFNSWWDYCAGRYCINLNRKIYAWYLLIWFQYLSFASLESVLIYYVLAWSEKILPKSFHWLCAECVDEEVRGVAHAVNCSKHDYQLRWRFDVIDEEIAVNQIRKYGKITNSYYLELSSILVLQGFREIGQL